MTLNEITLSHGGETIRFADLPASSQARLISEGFTHFYGNRVASGAIGDFRTKARQEYKATHGDQAWKDLSDSAKGAIEKAGIPDTESEEYKSALAEGKNEFWSKLKAGTLGEGRESAIKRSPMEVECDLIAKRETIEILTKQGLFETSAKKRVPKADDEFAIGKETLTFAELCVRRFARNKDRIESEARKILAAREKSAAKAASEELAEAF